MTAPVTSSSHGIPGDSFWVPWFHRRDGVGFPRASPHRTISEALAQLLTATDKPHHRSFANHFFSSLLLLKGQSSEATAFKRLGKEDCSAETMEGAERESDKWDVSCVCSCLLTVGCRELTRLLALHAPALERKGRWTYSHSLC